MSGDLDLSHLSLNELDWVVTIYGDRLHHAVLAPDEDAQLTEDGLLFRVPLTCGRTAATIMIPGVFTRIGASRCTRCCKRLGLPAGIGSPKNDPECRAILVARGLPR